MPRSITSTQQDHRSMSSSNQDSRSIPAHNEFKGHHHQRMTSSMDGTSAAVQSLIKSSSAAADNHKQLARIAGGNVMANRALPAVPQPGSNDRGRRDENKGRASSSNDLAVGGNSRSPSKLRRGRSVSNNK